MSTPFTAAAVQFSAGADPASNLATMTTLARRAADAGASLIAFPEASMARFGSPLAELAEPLDGRFADGVRMLASEVDALVIAGMFTPGEGGRVRNTLLATGRGVEASYDKIHLYDAFGSKESDAVTPGERLVTVDALGTTIGLATCYDLRFADQYRGLALAGARVIVTPASWGEGPGKATQWDTLVRARALDSQCWLVACDQAHTPPSGTDPLGIGRSAIVDPMGEVRGQLGEASGVLLGDIDPDTVTDARARLPILH